MHMCIYAYDMCLHVLCMYTYIHKIYVCTYMYIIVYIFILRILFLPPLRPLRHRAGVCNLQRGMHARVGAEGTWECHLWNLCAPGRDLTTTSADTDRLACVVFSCRSRNSHCCVCWGSGSQLSPLTVGSHLDWCGHAAVHLFCNLEEKNSWLIIVIYLFCFTTFKQSTFYEVKAREFTDSTFGAFENSRAR